MQFVYKRLEPSTIGLDLPPESCVVFIHGLVGSTTTWNRFVYFLTRHWVSNDSFGLEYYQYSVELTLPLFLDAILKAVVGGPSIDDLAKGLKTVIDEECKEYENVILIAHSMGGLIARQYLVDVMKLDKKVGKTKALITYASPHRGSAFATWYRIFGRYILFPFYLSSKQVVQMCRIKSDFLEKLNADWASLRIEKRIDFTRVVGLTDWVVDKKSAALKWNDPQVKHIPNKGHFSVLNPRNEQDTAFAIMFGYLKDFKATLEKRNEKDELDALEEDD